jgi:hypothetical protein
MAFSQRGIPPAFLQRLHEKDYRIIESGFYLIKNTWRFLFVAVKPVYNKDTGELMQCSTISNCHTESFSRLDGKPLTKRLIGTRLNGLYKKLTPQDKQFLLKDH